MKAQIFLVIAIAMTFAACQNDGDFANPIIDNNTIPLAFQSSNFGNPVDVGDPTLATCMNVLTQHTMTGNGRVIGSYTSGFPGVRGIYEITATGDVLSDPLKDGISTLRFTYDPKTRLVSGVLLTDFHNGYVLQQKFEGTAGQVIDGKTMTLTLSISSGSLFIDADTMDLNEGSISITLPTQPIGTFNLRATTKGVYCTQE